MKIMVMNEIKIKLSTIRQIKLLHDARHEIHQNDIFQLFKKVSDRNKLR